MKIEIKRVYDPTKSSDGYRILIDRLWPRGLSKQKASIDLWLKDIAPSNELRKWFNHDKSKWSDFKKKYIAELKHNTQPVSELKEILKKKKVTIVYGAKDIDHNNAVVLQEYLKKV